MNRINEWMYVNDVTMFTWHYTKKGIFVKSVSGEKRYFYPLEGETQIELLQDSCVPEARYCATDDYRNLGNNFWVHNK